MLVNFAKFRMLAHAFKVVTTYQKIEYPLESDAEHKKWFLNNWNVLSEAEMYTRAKQCEPNQKKPSSNMGSIREIIPVIGTISRRSSNLAPVNPGSGEIKMNRARSNSNSSSRPTLSASFLAGTAESESEEKKQWRKMFKP
jgi:hypothetical protein